MYKFIALFALVAVAFAEPEPEADPQYLAYNPYVTGYVPSVHQSVGYTKYANGAVVPADTPSVQAAKVQHHTAKAVEYAKKGFVPYTTFGYASPFHYLAKREADAEPQYYNPYTYSTGLYHGAYNYANTYAGVYSPYSTYSSVYARPYSAYGLRYKREADSESQYYNPYTYNTGLYHGAYNYANTYAGVYSSPYTYSAAYHPYTSVYGLRYKREADSESQYYTPYSYNTAFYNGAYRPYTTYNSALYSGAYRPYSSYYNYVY